MLSDRVLAWLLKRFDIDHWKADVTAVPGMQGRSERVRTHT